MSERGRPREHASGSRTNTAVRIPTDLLKDLKHEAIDREVSVNLIICTAVAEWMAKNKGKKRI